MAAEARSEGRKALCGQDIATPTKRDGDAPAADHDEGVSANDHDREERSGPAIQVRNSTLAAPGLLRLRLAMTCSVATSRVFRSPGNSSARP